MDFIGIIFTLVITTLFGYYSIDFIIGEKLLTPYKYALGFGVGYGLAAILLVLMQLFGFGWSWPAIVTFFILFLILNFSLKHFWTASFKLSISKKSVIALLIYLLLAFVFFEATVRPLSSWDGWSSWEMRARAMSIDKRISIEQFQYLQTEYPLVVPLYTAFAYGVIGEINDTAILLISWYFYLLVGIVSYIYISTKTNSSYGLFFTFLILSTQNLIRHGGRYEGGLADIIMSYFLLSALILLSLFIEKKKTGTLVLISIFLGIIANIKNEGIFFSVVVFAATFYYLVQFKQLKKIYVLSLYFIPFLSWILFKIIEPLPQGILDIKPHASFQTITHLIVVELEQYFNIQNWNLGWLFVLVSTFYLFIKKRLTGVLLILIILTFSYSLIFLFSKVDPIEHAKGVLDRLLLHIFPSFIVFVSIGLYPYLKSNRLLKRFGLV